MFCFDDDDAVDDLAHTDKHITTTTTITNMCFIFFLTVQVNEKMTSVEKIFCDTYCCHNISLFSTLESFIMPAPREEYDVCEFDCENCINMNDISDCNNCSECQSMRTLTFAMERMYEIIDRHECTYNLVDSNQFRVEGSAVTAVFEDIFRVAESLGVEVNYIDSDAISVKVLPVSPQSETTNNLIFI